MREVYYSDPRKMEERAAYGAARYAKRQADPALKASDRDRDVKTQRARRQANPERSRAYSKKYRDKLYEIIVEAKDHPCLKCGHSYPPWVMDLHRRDPAVKEENLARFAWGGKAQPGMTREETLRAEITKCDVLCANCHREHHHGAVELAA